MASAKSARDVGAPSPSVTAASVSVGLPTPWTEATTPLVVKSAQRPSRTPSVVCSSANTGVGATGTAAGDAPALTVRAASRATAAQRVTASASCASVRVTSGSFSGASSTGSVPSTTSSRTESAPARRCGGDSAPGALLPRAIAASASADFGRFVAVQRTWAPCATPTA
jgi:hypothetical protein